MRTRRRQLTARGKEQLLRLGLTIAQVYWIDHNFHSIAEDLAQPARNPDVKAEFERVARHLRALDKWFREAPNSTMRNGKKVALGHIGIAANLWNARARNRASLAMTLPQRMEPHLLVRALLGVTKAAGRHFPRGDQKRLRSTVSALKTLELAINRPDDAASQNAAKRFELRRDGDSPFALAAGVIFQEVLGKSAPDPDTGIRRLLELRKRKPPEESQGEQTPNAE